MLPRRMRDPRPVADQGEGWYLGGGSRRLGVSSAGSVSARQGIGMAELEEALETALAEQETADDDNVRGLSIHDLTGSGNILVYHVASLLSASELTGALSACRAWHSMMPDAVRILDGVKWHTYDEMVIALLQRFTRATCIDMRSCKFLTDLSVTAIAELCPISFS